MEKNKLSSMDRIRWNVENILYQRNISHKMFSDMLGMDYSNVHRHINGQRSISLKLLDKFADALKVEPKELIT